jgi:hypothetical protein
MDEITTKELKTYDVGEHAMSKHHDVSEAEGTTQTGRGKWQVPVDVYLVSADPLRFHIESPIQSAPDTDLIFHNNCHPGFEVVFTLHDQTGDPNGYSFEKHKEDAVWSQLGEGEAACPKSEIWTVFKPLRVSDDRTTLAVINENSGEAVGPFQYALNVTNGSRKLSLDPGGNNMNGSTMRK